MTFKDSNNISYLCFGGEDWWYHNRAHIDMQLMRRFARLGTTLYINSIVIQKPSLKKNIGGEIILRHKLIRKTRSIFIGLKKSDAGFWVYSPITLPVHHISWTRPLIELALKVQIERVMRRLEIHNPIIWVVCPAACETAINMKKTKLVYQRADRFEEYPNVDVEIIKSCDQKLKAAADLTIFVNKMLFDEESSQCKNAIYLDHGVDYEMFASADKIPDQPSDMAEIPRPIVGFYGGFAKHTTDIAFLEKVVDILANSSFVFIGSASQECNELKARKNVWMLGQKPYKQIPHYGKCFDVAIMPWKQNRWIEACNPIKLKEYLALGKPVVSTPFNELKKYLDVVYKADTPESFAKCIERALVEDCPDIVTARRKKVQNASWDSKAQMVLNELFPNRNDS